MLAECEALLIVVIFIVDGTENEVGVSKVADGGKDQKVADSENDEVDAHNGLERGRDEDMRIQGEADIVGDALDRRSIDTLASAGDGDAAVLKGR